jgi:hypothetical protein
MKSPERTRAKRYETAAVMGILIEAGITPAAIDVTAAPPARSFVEVFSPGIWLGGRGRSVLVAVAVAVTSGCGGDGSEERATDFALKYLRAADEGDVKRLCTLRTDRALRGWGGQATCERRATGLAVDPPPPSVGPGLRNGLERKALAVKARTAKVVSDDTSTTDDRARVVIDFGEAVLEDGHAVAGEILEMDLTSHGDSYKVERLGFAVFAD